MNERPCCVCVLLAGVACGMSVPIYIGMCVCVCGCMCVCMCVCVVVCVYACVCVRQERLPAAALHGGLGQVCA